VHVPYLAVATGGALGAIARYMTVLFAQNQWGLNFPYGTLIVNAFGSLLAGFLLAIFVGRYNASEYWRLFFFTGFLGAYTTFSSFAAESLFMFEQSQWLKLITNILVNNLGSLAMVLLGSELTKLMLKRYLELN
jgi:CrcB protein